MMRAVICKGDPTSHGGKVIEGNETATFEGRPISNKGHMTYCPQCKGTFAIVEGVEFHSFFGEGTAVDGMKTACGAKLIATTTKGKMMLDNQASQGNGSDESGQFDTTTGLSETDQVFGDLLGETTWVEFTLMDLAGPIPSERYVLTDPSGRIHTGIVDQAGYARLENILRGRSMLEFPDLRSADGSSKE